ncbi:MAG: Elongation factor [Planctomycetota bacterium]|jgi:elongation factor P
MKSTDLRPGMAIKMDGKLYVITQYTHVTPGNLRAFVQVKIRDIEKGTIIEKRLRSGEEVEQVELDRRPMQYLYAQGKVHVFMDNQNYEQHELPEDVVGDMPLYVLPDNEVIVLWCDGRPVSIEMPNVVELLVTDTPPGIKGATATNQLKEATMETGLKTRVPPFITNGEKIRINTTDGSYASRA